MAGASATRGRHRRLRTRPLGAAHFDAQRGGRERPRALYAPAERLRPALGQRTLGASKESMVTLRWARPGHRGHTTLSPVAAARRAPVLRHRAAELRVLSLSISA